MAEYYKKYLIECISACLTKQSVSPPREDLNWKNLYYFSKKNSLCQCVYHAVKNADFVSESIKSRFRAFYDMNISKQLSEEKMLAEIFDVLNQKGIKYMPLKGYLLRSFYPEQFLRYSSDTDIYICAEDEEIITETVKSFGPEISFRDTNEIIFKQKPYINLEFHKQLISPITRIGKLYDYKPFVSGINKSGSQYLMTDNDFYIYHICHLAQHFYASGAGIKFFVDIEVMLKNMNLDFQYINEQLDKYNLKKFSDECIKLVRHWFENGNDYNKDFENLILNAESFGLDELTYFNETDGGRRTYFLTRLFPSAERLEYRYPKIKNRKYLLPYYWVKRIFSSLNKAGSFKIKKEADIPDDYSDIEILYREIGLL